MASRGGRGDVGGGYPQPYGRGPGGGGYPRPYGSGQGGGRGRGGRGGGGAPVRVDGRGGGPGGLAGVRPVAPRPAAPPAVPTAAEQLAPALPAAAPESGKSLTPPVRPGYGTVGQRITLLTNHFIVSIGDNDIFQYDVSINPKPKKRRINKVLMSMLMTNYRVSSLGGKLCVYDGNKILYTAGQLPSDVMNFMIKRQIEYEIKIRYASQANLHHLGEFLTGLQRDSPQGAIQALNIVLKESPSLRFLNVGRSFFSRDFSIKCNVGDGLECLEGYYQSLRPTQMGLSLNIDISSTIFYKPISVINFVKDCLNGKPGKLSDIDHLKLKKALQGVRIVTTHEKDKRRAYKIIGITSNPLSQLNFLLNGTQTTIVEYFLKRYSYILEYTSWPCLQAGSNSYPIYLPMEVCTIMEGQRPRKLTAKQMTSLLQARCVGPSSRKERIKEMGWNNYAEDEVVQGFGIDVSNQMVEVQAHVLPPPQLKYRQSGELKAFKPTAGQWNMINKKIVNGGTVQTWTCLNFSGMTIDAVDRLCSNLAGTCKSIGMDFNPKPVAAVRKASPNKIEDALKDVHKEAPDLQLLIVILPNAIGQYGKVKKICETELGIVSQCLKPDKASKANRQYLESVALKINVKVGATNTVLQIPLVPLVNNEATIIFGADVTHPAPGEDSSGSIAAVVASMDPEISKYRAVVSVQPHGQEIIQDLFRTAEDPQTGTPMHGGMIRDMLLAFYRRNNGMKPKRIIFFRDGVGEGQFAQVLMYEMDAIRKACLSLDGKYWPTVTFVVVQKRHHTRFFPKEVGTERERNKSENVLPGTVVDTVICHPREFDFYLCSHASTRGTSRAAHYHVLYDENNFSADHLQSLINNLCYTYARCTRSVSIVPPVYYAHLAAFRARHYDEFSGGNRASAVTGGGAAGPSAAVRQLPQIKNNVKEVMFYC